MFNSEETELIKRILDEAATYVRTPAWRKRAVELHRAFLDGRYEVAELDFVLTVAIEGNKPFATYMRDREQVNAIEALRDRLRVAA